MKHKMRNNSRPAQYTRSKMSALASFVLAQRNSYIMTAKGQVLLGEICANSLEENLNYFTSGLFLLRR